MNGVLFQEKITLLINVFTSLKHNFIWIIRPQFLHKNESVSFESEVLSTNIESTDVISHLTVHCKPPYLSFIKCENYSSFFKLIKHIACILKLKPLGGINGKNCH